MDHVEPNTRRLNVHPELLRPQMWHITSLQQPTQHVLHDIPRISTVSESEMLSLSDVLLSKFLHGTESSTFIENYFEHGGIGDRVIALRHAFALARHFPERSLIIDAHSVLPLARLAYPDNVSMTRVLGNLPHDTNKLLLSGLLSYDERVSNAMMSAPDFAVMRMLKQAGATVDHNKYYQSILQVTQEDLQNHPVASDLLIIPDALEMQNSSQIELRSRKSLSSNKWELIFRQLDPSKHVAIVLGISHPDYCQRVVYAAKRAGLQRISTVQGTLDDVVDAVLTTRKFVGMDSGTTHIAAEVVKAAQAVGRTIEFRELFNEGVASFENYGIAGEQFTTLVVNSKGTDIDEIDPLVVAEFIKS